MSKGAAQAAGQRVSAPLRMARTELLFVFTSGKENNIKSSKASTIKFLRLTFYLKKRITQISLFSFLNFLKLFLNLLGWLRRQQGHHNNTQT